jgi:hypothetical protein
MASDLVPEAEVCFLRGWPPLALWVGEGCVPERGWEGALSWLLWWGGRPILLFLLSPDSENQGIRYRWHPCSLFMIRVKVPGSSFMLCLGPGPPSLLHLTRANAEKPYAGDTITNYKKVQNSKSEPKNFSHLCTFNGGSLNADVTKQILL